MGWEKILKGKISTSDIKILNYILRDGEFRTINKIMDEIYDLIQKNKKLGRSGTRRSPIQITTFGQSKSKMKGFISVFLTSAVPNLTANIQIGNDFSV